MTIDNRWLLSRRALLGGIAFAPFVRVGTARAASTPKRLLVVHVPEGMWTGAARPTGANGLTLANSVLAPLEPMKSRVTVLNRLDIKSANQGPGGDGHHRNVPHMLTGTELQSVDVGGGPSVDQVIAQSFGTQTKFASLHASVRIIYNDANSRPFWSGPGRVVPSTGSPWDLYNRVFKGVTPMAGTPGTAATADASATLKKSALDASLAEITRLRERLGKSDKDRLDSYADALRDIEGRLAASTPGKPGAGATTGCTPPTLPATYDARDELNYQKVGRLHVDLLVAALQCDLTRVATLQWGNSNDQCSYRFTPAGQNAPMGINEVGHDLSHNNRNVDPTGAKKTKVTQFYAGEFAYILSRLDAIKEGGGSMLDNTVVLWVSEFGECNGHAANNLMWVLGGNVGGALKPGGRLLELNNRSVNDLHTTLCNAFGVNIAKFGNAAYCAGPIAELRA